MPADPTGSKAWRSLRLDCRELNGVTDNGLQTFSPKVSQS